MNNDGSYDATVKGLEDQLAEISAIVEEFTAALATNILATCRLENILVSGAKGLRMSVDYLKVQICY